MTPPRALALDVVVDDDLVRDRLRRLGGADVRGGRRTRSQAVAGCRTPASRPRVKEATTCCGRFGEDVIGSSLATEGATLLVVSHVTPIKVLLRLALDAGSGVLYRLHRDLASLSIAEVLRRWGIVGAIG